PDAKKAAPKPTFRLIAASTSVDIIKEKGDPSVYLDLGTYLTAENSPFELKATRKSYKDPIVVQQTTRVGKKVTTRTLPKGLVKDFTGLPGFTEITVKDSAGKVVASAKERFCPNNASGRVRPDAPATSKYPESCPENPFTLGSVWGVENGWASNTYNGWYSPPPPVSLPSGGTYTATVSVAKKYRDLFGIAHQPQTVTMNVTEVEPGGPGGPGGRSAAGHAGHHGAAHAGHGTPPKPTLPQALSGTAPSYNVGHGPHTPAPPALPWALKKSQRSVANVGDRPGQTDGSRKAPALAPNAKRPAGKATVPAGPKPDLRSLPAFDIRIGDGEADVPGKDFLTFSANVWNAGPGKLVVDGFRSPGKEVMDAYQYFYDTKGKQVGFTPSGTMEWDPRAGHEHWHFTDFASYRLLKADKKVAVRSGKEAFCLANTDAVDYTVKNANWHPNNTDLRTACGQRNSISVREALDVGSGDTYSQYLPGQSFDITDLPNGTYYIDVLANPEKRLKETSLTNNSALRKVVLGGTTGARTVTVPPHDLVNAN
ncbi:lysyl oxidase family protein, partial [Streptomyces sp. NPDC055078]